MYEPESICGKLGARDALALDSQHPLHSDSMIMLP